MPNAPTLTEAVVLSHCKRHLTGYELPRVIEFRSEPLPKSNIGKILRRELRDGGAATPVGPRGTRVSRLVRTQPAIAAHVADTDLDTNATKLLFSLGCQ